MTRRTLISALAISPLIKASSLFWSMNKSAGVGCSYPAPTEVYTTYNNALSRSNFDGWLGFSFTVQATSIVVQKLGLRVFSGTHDHLVKLVAKATGLDVPGASVTITASGVDEELVEVALGSPVTLTSGLSYYLVAQFASGVDNWNDFNSQGFNAAISVSNGVYGTGPGDWNETGGANSSAGNPDMKFNLAGTCV